MRSRRNRQSKRLSIVTVLFVTLGVLSAAKSAHADTQSVPLSIESDCSVDVTAKLLTWIASVADGSTLSFTPEGCYRIDGVLKVSDRHDLTFEGNNATFRAVTDGKELPAALARTRSHWSFRNGSGVTLRNMTIRGANPNAGTGESAYYAPLEAQHGIELLGVQGGLIDNVQIYDVYGDFVYLGMGYANRLLTRNVTVRGSHFERNGRQGLSWAGAEDIRVENNFISQVRRSMFDIEPNFTDGHVRRVTINANHLGTHRLNFLSNEGAASIIEDITVSNNVLTGSGLNMTIKPPSGRRARIKIIGNVSDVGYGNPAGSVMYFKDTDGIEVSGNVQRLQVDRGMSAVQLYGSTNARVFDNSFVNAVTTLRAQASASGVESSDFQACGNKIVSTGAFVDPVACVPADVRIDTPLNRSSLSDTVSVTASVNGALGVERVDFYVDGALQGSDADAPYGFAWDTRGLPDDSAHAVKAVAVGAGGDWSNEVAVTVNNGLTESWNNVDEFAWPARWRFEGATSGIDKLDIKDGQGQLTDEAGASGVVVAYIDGKSAVSSDQSAQFRASSNVAGFGFMARRSDLDSDTYYYAVAVPGAPDNLRIKKMVDGVPSNLAYVSRPIVSNVDYRMRFVVAANADPAKTTLQVKVWEAGAPEPAAYDISKAVVEPRLQGVDGRFGLAYGLANARKVWTDSYAAAIPAA